MKKNLFLLIIGLKILLFNDVNAQDFQAVDVKSYSGFGIPVVASKVKDEQNQVYRKWWQVALADAAGTLGGVASGMQICKHWLCALFGGVIGGAGASVAVARESALAIHKIDAPVSSRNNYEDAGRLHNEIISDYYKAFSGNPPGDLFDFVILNKSRYGIDEIPFSKEQYKSIVEIGKKNYNTIEEAIEKLNEIIPHGIEGKNEFLETVGKLLRLPDIKEFNEKVLQVEEEFYDTNFLSDSGKLLYQSFFSVLRHSVNFWGI